MHFTPTILAAILAATAAAAPLTTFVEPNQSANPSKRQTPCGTWTVQTRLRGDGAPSDRTLKVQVSVSPYLFKTPSFLFPNPTSTPISLSPMMAPMPDTYQEKINCANAPECSATYGSYESITVEASLGGGPSWISGGFGVSYSLETGNDYTCTGETGGSVCVNKFMPHTDVRCYFPLLV